MSKQTSLMSCSKSALSGALALTFFFAVSSCKEESVDVKNYPDDVGEIFVTKCAVSGCHTDASKVAAGGLSLENWDRLFEGSVNKNAVVIPYRPSQSFIMAFINTDSASGPIAAPTMPYNEDPLSADEIAMIRNWILQGAPDRNGFVKFSDNPQRAKGYIANQGCDLIAVVDLESSLIMRYVDAGATLATEAPHNIRVSPDGEHFYASFIAGSVFQKFRTSDDSFVGEAEIGFGSWNTFGITSDSKRAFVVNFNSSGTIAVIDLETMTMTHNYGGSGFLNLPHGIALKDDNTLYITSQLGNFIYKIDVSDLDNPEVEEIPLQTKEPTGTSPRYDPHEIVFSPDGSEYVVTCQTSNEIRFLSAANDSLLAVVPTGVFTQEIAFSTSTDYLFISCTEDNVTFPGLVGSIYVVNYKTHSVVKTIAAGYQSHGIAVDDDNKKVYVVNRNINPNGPAPHHTTECAGRNGYLTVIDLNTLELLTDIRAELSVDPYFIALRK